MRCRQWLYAEEVEEGDAVLFWCMFDIITQWYSDIASFCFTCPHISTYKWLKRGHNQINAQETSPKNWDDLWMRQLPTKGAQQQSKLRSTHAHAHTLTQHFHYTAYTESFKRTVYGSTWMEKQFYSSLFQFSAVHLCWNSRLHCVAQSRTRTQAHTHTHAEWLLEHKCC